MKLLVGIQTSESSDIVVLPTSKQLAEAASAEVVLLNVLNPMTDAADVVALTRAEAVEQVRAEREAYLQRLANDFDPPARVLVAEAAHGEDVPNAIARVAREEEADILVIATNRASGVRGLILGSVAQHLLRLSPCPILVVRLD